jgi:hypothetical protein
MVGRDVHLVPERLQSAPRGDSTHGPLIISSLGGLSFPFNAFQVRVKSQKKSQADKNVCFFKKNGGKMFLRPGGLHKNYCRGDF